jgi:hypothetical protein
MAAAASSNPSNPFDDPETNDLNGSPITSNILSRNPFETDSNPFLSQDQNHAFDDETITTTVPAEASWQFLGDIPYRRVPVYSNVNWAHRQGYNNRSRAPSAAEDQKQLERHLSNLSTKLVGCPNGGPIATISVPLQSRPSSNDGEGITQQSSSQVRLQTNSGATIAVMDFPPRESDAYIKKYSAADILTLGFTSRAILVVVLSDSLCFTFDCSLNEILPPFYILPGASTELQHAAVYEGGVAVLAKNKASAIVELLDDHDDPSYPSHAHVAARFITPATEPASTVGDATSVPAHYALITPLPTAVYASEHFLSYVTLAVLPRQRTASLHPEVFVSTTDNSVIVCKVDTTEITDVNCRARIA